MSVYFLQSKRTSLVKIGFTNNVKERVAKLRAQDPTLVLIRKEEGGRTLERWFHNQFGSARRHGEWFSFCEDMRTVQPPRILDGSAREIRRGIEDAALIADISKALRAEIPAWANESKWLEHTAVQISEQQSVKITKRTIRNHLCGTHMPLASVFVAYLGYFGPRFEARVLGEAREPMDDLDALQRRIIRDVGELKSRVAERKEGTG